MFLPYRGDNEKQHISYIKQAEYDILNVNGYDSLFWDRASYR